MPTMLPHGAYSANLAGSRRYSLIRDCIDDDMSGKLETLRPMLEQSLDVIQVNGLCVVGTPVGPKDYVREYVRNKCGTICKDIDQMRVCADLLIRYQLLKFWMNTRLSFLSRNVTPDNMATDCDDRAHIGPAHVDNKIVQEVLRAATGDTLMHAPQLTQNWCKLKVQSPHHEGVYAITPTAASGLAAFYSATSRFVAFLANLPQEAHGCTTDMCSQITTRGLTPSYKHSSRPTHASFKSTSASNGNCKAPHRPLPSSIAPSQLSSPHSPS